MTRDNLLFAIIGILFGFIIGFLFAANMNQRYNTMAPLDASAPLPADHPPVQGGDNRNPQAMFAEVQAAMKKAREEPNNFDAQVNAARLEYQIQRYDEAIAFLLKANQLQPDNFEVVAMLGEANLEGGHFDVAEKWYSAALMKKPGDIGLLASLAFLQLQKGDAKKAEDAIAKLEKADPSNTDLPQFRDRLASLKSGSQPK